MASTLALGAVCTAIRAALVASVSLTGYVSTRVYPDSDGDAPQKPTYPYVQIESAGELPENTMGAANLSKWGSVARVQVRVATQSRSDAQPNTIAGIVKQVLDGQPLTVSGYTDVTVEYTDLFPIRDFAGLIPTREWVLGFDVLATQ